MLSALPTKDILKMMRASIAERVGRLLTGVSATPKQPQLFSSCHCERQVQLNSFVRVRRRCGVLPVVTFDHSSLRLPSNLHHRQTRTFVTGGQKRALREQQKKDGKLENKPEDTTILKNPKIIPPSAVATRPPSLIRTDFVQETAQNFILPSGYEIDTTASDGSTDGNNARPQTVAYVDYKELYDPKVHLPSAPQDWSDYEPATPLWEELAAQIGVLGRPMTVAEFIQHALLHPKHGYYSQPMRDSAEEENDDEDDIFSDDEFEEESVTIDNPIFGPRGDFVTAPEICQVFGESIQVWMITQWEAMGKPKALQWVEFGPGRGTLMADMVRFALTHHKSKSIANDKLQEYGSALQVIHFIEPSRPLREKQQSSLQEQLGDFVNWTFHNSPAPREEAGYPEEKAPDSSSKPTIQVYWHDSFAALSAMIMRRKQRTMGLSQEDATKIDYQDMSSMPLFVVCQEFFDALPVHAFEMTEDGWRERMVDMAIRDELLEDEDDDHGNSTKPSTNNTSNQLESQKRPRLRIVLAPEATPALKALLHVDEEGRILSGDQTPMTDATVEPGQVVEVCPEGILLMQDIAALLEQQGGAAIVVDYGEEGSTDSLRGFWKHRQTHFLSLPGQTDVTADVDFTALKHAVNFARPRRLALQNESNGADNEGRQAIKAYGPIPQGKFLVAMGAKKRVIQCIESDGTTDEEAEELFFALERLVAPDQMGIRYKVLAIAAERMKEESGGSYTVPPAGF